MFIKKANNRFIINLFGLKIKFKNIFFNPLEDMCCIENLDYLKKQGTKFPHPVGIVIHKNVTVGKNCKIYQNVTIGGPKKSKVPVLGNRVFVSPNSCIIGDIKIGDNVTIGAGSVVVKDVPSDTVVAGNPAVVIKKKSKKSKADK